jgi:hypothetical protein
VDRQPGKKPSASALLGLPALAWILSEVLIRGLGSLNLAFFSNYRLLRGSPQARLTKPGFFY